MSAPILLRRRASLARARMSGSWGENDYDVFDGGREVGRIYRFNAASEAWWWGVCFTLTGRRTYGTADTLDDAMAAFRGVPHLARAELKDVPCHNAEHA
jgi:hypothetical protein